MVMHHLASIKKDILFYHNTQPICKVNHIKGKCSMWTVVTSRVYCGEWDR